MLPDIQKFGILIAFLLFSFFIQGQNKIQKIHFIDIQKINGEFLLIEDMGKMDFLLIRFVPEEYLNEKNLLDNTLDIIKIYPETNDLQVYYRIPRTMITSNIYYSLQVNNKIEPILIVFDNDKQIKVNTSPIDGIKN